VTRRPVPCVAEFYPAEAGPLACPNGTGESAALRRVLERLGEAEEHLKALEARREQLHLQLSIPRQFGKTNTRAELLALVNQIALAHRRITDLKKQAAL